MVVARPIEPGSVSFDSYSSTAPIVPTRILTDPEELDRHIIQNGYANAFYKYMENPPLTDPPEVKENGLDDLNNVDSLKVNGIEEANQNTNDCDIIEDEIILPTTPIDNECGTPDSETEKYTVTLHKGEYGLGQYHTINNHFC